MYREFKVDYQNFTGDINEIHKEVDTKSLMEKSKDFFNQILNTKNANTDIIKETQKRLNRDLSE